MTRSLLSLYVAFAGGIAQGCEEYTRTILVPVVADGYFTNGRWYSGEIRAHQTLDPSTNPREESVGLLKFDRPEELKRDDSTLELVNSICWGALQLNKIFDGSKADGWSCEGSDSDSCSYDVRAVATQWNTQIPPPYPYWTNGDIPSPGTFGLSNDLGISTTDLTEFLKSLYTQVDYDDGGLIEEVAMDIFGSSEGAVSSFESGTAKLEFILLMADAPDDCKCEQVATPGNGGASSAGGGGTIVIVIAVVGGILALGIGLVIFCRIRSYSSQKPQQKSTAQAPQHQAQQYQAAPTPAPAPAAPSGGGAIPVAVAVPVNANNGPKCTKCGARSTAGNRFCAECGGTLESGPPPTDAG